LEENSKLKEELVEEREANAIKQSKIGELETRLTETNNLLSSLQKKLVEKIP